MLLLFVWKDFQKFYLPHEYFYHFWQLDINWAIEILKSKEYTSLAPTQT